MLYSIRNVNMLYSIIHKQPPFIYIDVKVELYFENDCEFRGKRQHTLPASTGECLFFKRKLRSTSFIHWNDGARMLR